MTLSTSEILSDVRSAAWLESELHPDLDRHRRHEMADICEGPNIDRVWRVISLASAEIRLAISRILDHRHPAAKGNFLERPDNLFFHLRMCLPAPFEQFIKEKTHEYIVARVLADRLAVIIPSAAPTWEKRAEESLSALTVAAVNARLAMGHVRRPLSPL